MRTARRLLPGEDPSSLHLSDAEHWTLVFQELVDEHQALLTRLEARAGGPIEGELELLNQNLAWLRTRLAFWLQRRLELSY
jgi:hypothetical protein